MTPPLRVLITGATGFTGRHLSQLALAHGAAVFGFSRHDTFVTGVTGYTGDIADRTALAACLTASRPDWIFHLAAQVHGSAHTAPGEMQRVNIEGTRQLLTTVRAIVPSARVLLASSSGLYGQPVEPGQAISETTPLQPGSVYASTKAAQESLAVSFFREHGLHVIRARTFNQTGPGEPAGLVCGAIARQLARIESGLEAPVLRTITLRTARDFCDVRDVAAGYWSALAHGAAGEAYNVCSGTSHRIARIVELLLTHSTHRDITVVESQPVPAPGAILDQLGDASRLRACSGWSPRIALERSLGDLLADWRLRIRGSP